MNQAAILAKLPSFLLDAETGGPATWWLMTVLVAAIVFLLIMILVARVQAFVSLILTSILVAILSGMALTQIPDTIVNGMAGALGTLATIVGLGAIFGQVLEYSGGAQSLATSLHKGFGEKRAPFAMILVGFLISIPVFFDVALVILAPILVAMAKSSGKSILRYGLPLCAAMAVTHACIPPTPGPVLVAANLGADLGQVILWGTVVGFPTALISGLIGAKMGDKIQVPIPKIFTEAEAPAEGHKKVAAWEVVALILLPIVLILGRSLVDFSLQEEQKIVSTAISEAGGLPSGERKVFIETASADLTRHELVIPFEYSETDDGELVRTDFPLKAYAVPTNFFYQIILFLGHPVTALVLTTLVTLVLLGTLRGIPKSTLMELSTKALGPAGIIILVTGAGGVFKAILVDSGVGAALANAFDGLDVPLIALAFLLTFVIRVTQGSATVAMIGGSALMAEAVQAALAANQISGADVALTGIAIACGATMCSHVNDSGFWVVKNYLGMTEKQCLSTFTVITTIIGVVGFAIAWTLSIFV